VEGQWRAEGRGPKGEGRCGGPGERVGGGEVGPAGARRARRKAQRATRNAQRARRARRTARKAQGARRKAQGVRRARRTARKVQGARRTARKAQGARRTGGGMRVGPLVVRGGVGKEAPSESVACARGVGVRCDGAAAWHRAGLKMGHVPASEMQGWSSETHVGARLLCPTCGSRGGVRAWGTGERPRAPCRLRNVARIAHWQLTRLSTVSSAATEHCECVHSVSVGGRGTPC